MANITIVGSGNSGCAHAFTLGRRGHKITMLKTSRSLHDENFEQLQAQGGIYGLDTPSGAVTEEFVPISCITRDPAEAFKDTEIVYVLTQSLQHESVAETICPYIRNIKALCVVPGNMGSVFFRRHLPEHIIVAEGESTIIDARISSPGHVHILFKNVRNALSFNPSSDTERGFAIFSQIFDTYSGTRTNIVETAMHNPNLVVHTIGTIMSAARIEKARGEFYLYREGFSSSIWNIIDALDLEKNMVICAYGGKPASYLECCKYRNEEDLTKDAREVFEDYSMNGSPKGPDSIHNRYLTEDVPNGLCLLESLAHHKNIDTPITSALITLAGTLIGTDFRTGSRTVETMGLTDEDIAKL